MTLTRSTKWSRGLLGINQPIMVSTNPAALYPELATTEKLTSRMQWTGSEYIFINRAKGYFITSTDGSVWTKRYSPLGSNILVAVGLGKVATIKYGTTSTTGYVYDYATQLWTTFTKLSDVPVGFYFNGSYYGYWLGFGSTSSMLRSSFNVLSGWSATAGPNLSTYPLPDRGLGMSSTGDWITCSGTGVTFTGVNYSNPFGPTTIPTASSNNMTSSSFGAGGHCVCDGVAGNGRIYKYVSTTWDVQIGPTTIDTIVNGNDLHVAWRSDAASTVIKKSPTGLAAAWTDVAVTSRTYYSGAYGSSGWKFWTSDGIVSVTL